LNKCGFIFKQYNDEIELDIYKKRNEEIENKHWSSWTNNPIDGEYTAIEGCLIEIRFECCDEEILVGPIAVPAPFLGADNESESENTSETEDFICPKCEKNYSVYIGNTMYQMFGYWDDEPDFYEYRVRRFDSCNNSEDDEDLWETWP